MKKKKIKGGKEKKRKKEKICVIREVEKITIVVP